MESETAPKRALETWCVAAAMASELAPSKALGLPGVEFLVTSMGSGNAERVASAWLDRHKADALVHIGFAGALTSSLSVGDAVVAERVEGRAESGVDQRLLDAAKKVRPPDFKLLSGVIVTVDRILASAEEKRVLASQRSNGGVACVDMESAAVAHVCRTRSIPYLGIRCITDALDEDLPMDLNECRGRSGGIESMRVMWAAAHHPSSISGLLDLRRRARMCAQHLSCLVRAVIEGLRSPA